MKLRRRWPWPAGRIVTSAALIITLAVTWSELAGTVLAQAGGPAIGTAAPAWTVSRSPDAMISPDGLQAVSCPNTGFCAAVSATIANTWSSGHPWQVQGRLPSPVGAAGTRILAITCTSARFCLAVGDYQATPSALNTTRLADRWNGKSWSIVLRSGPGQLEAVSCSAYNACTAVGSSYGFIDNPSNAIAERWNGSRWAAQSVPLYPQDGEIDFAGVSCPAVNVCLATGTDSNLGQGAMPIAGRWNGRKWSHTPVPDPYSVNTDELWLGAMSCSGASACTAIGYLFTGDNAPTQPVAERWNGSTWAAQTVPAAVVYVGYSGPALGAISCPAATYCLTAFGGHTAVWSGGSWTLSAATPVPGGAFAGVSCRSATWCTAAGSVTPAAGESPTLAERWNGTDWTAQPTAGDAAGALPNLLRSVSCPSAASCEAVGTAGSGVLAAQWTGTGWSLQDPPEPTGATTTSFAAVSCAGTGCVAVGSATVGGTAAGLAETWDGAAWSLLPSPPAATALTGISCPAAGICVTVGTSAAGPVIDSWDGTTWTEQPAAAGPATLTALSCPAAASCLAVGGTAAGKAAAESWDGASWTALPVPAGGALAAISCPATDSCTTVGAADTIEHWNGTAWSAQRAAAAAANLAGVSCVSASNCFAVGAYLRGALTSPELVQHWNGTVWSLKYPPEPSGSTASALHAVSCVSWRWCMAAGGYRNRFETVLNLSDLFS